ncbi:gliding motility-associated C-terminal domain-containing protein [Dyadobacter sp. CY312]|uniref:T9SS type B sorting domain-containing protein n=1 Tax=Dyadobacter sp. CY312 TaxID=2907303 RepID=UPI001F1E457A|nr:gliding motility-associated C-terminal domain-containing protein [Dyadobacter sp. CY312]MCE7042180.1 gliding motility-associated C-terminal domain-containing protein [Dyadobacter sp. CY312]
MKLKTHLVYGVALLLIGGRVSAQGLCSREGGSFTLSSTEVCVAAPIKVTNLVSNPANEGIGYVTRYDGTSTQNLAYLDLLPSLTFSYNFPGNYTVLQRVFTTNGQTLYHCENVKVIESSGVTASYSSCGGGNINLVLTQDVVLNAYDQIEINWGDGSPIKKWNKGDALILPHTYTSTSVSPTVKITGLHNNSTGCKEGVPKSIPIKFEVAELAGIQVNTLEMSAGGSLSFTYKGIDAIKTQVQYSADGGANFTNGGSWSLGGTNTFSIKPVIKDVAYTVRLMSIDNCGGSLPSKPITSMAIKAVSNSGAVKLSWNKYPVAGDFKSYELYKNGNLYKTFNDIGEVEFTDTDVDCGDVEVYYVKAILVGASSKSAEELIKVDNTGSVGLAKASVSVSGDKVLIVAEAPGKSYDLTIERAESVSGLFKRVMILNSQNEYLDDNNVHPSDQSYCYKLSYSSCGQHYPATPPICTILLQKKHSTFTWSNDLPFLEPIDDYTMLQTGSSGSAQEIVVGPNLSFTARLDSDSDPEYTFQIKATSDNGNWESLSNAVVYKRNTDIFFPTAFTPNDDFKNDDIKPITTELTSYSFTIYNRWGGVVFHTTDQNLGWNGKVKNELAELGWYLYKITFKDDLDQKVEKSGTFMLLR